MIKLGKFQTLTITDEVNFGVYLKENKEDEERVLLPKQQVPENAAVGDKMEVFIYKDSSDRLIATTNRPKITLEQINRLRVAEVTNIGAFLDWGLEKDLLLPYSEQRGNVKEGQECLVALYIDKSDRLCATMNIGDYIKHNPKYEIDQWVDGIVYSINMDIGAFVLVDYRFEGLIKIQDFKKELKIGDFVHCRVSRITDEGKMDLSFTEKIHVQMDKDAELILDKMMKNDGELSLNDKSVPELIKEELGMSKKAFKRAVGRLMKEERIVQNENGLKIRE